MLDYLKGASNHSIAHSVMWIAQTHTLTQQSEQKVCHFQNPCSTVRLTNSAQKLKTDPKITFQFVMKERIDYL